MTVPSARNVMVSFLDSKNVIRLNACQTVKSSQTHNTWVFGTNWRKKVKELYLVGLAKIVLLSGQWPASEDCYCFGKNLRINSDLFSHSFYGPDTFEFQHISMSKKNLSGHKFSTDCVYLCWKELKHRGSE